MGRLIFNKYFFTILYIVVIVFIHYHFFDIFGKFIIKVDLQTIATANIGLFASLTGFLIAAIPFFLQIILKQNYLIIALGNNLHEIVFALYVLLIIFVISVIVLLFDIESQVCRFIIWAIYLYLYIFLIYYILEILKIIEQLVSDLKTLKKEEDGAESATVVLKKILKEIKSKN